MILNVAVEGSYPELGAKTQRFCTRWAPDCWQMFWNGEYPHGCPKHSQSMYAFKIFALREAIAAGFRYILWMDTAFQPVAPLDRLWALIERDGWYAPQQGDSKLGEWCSDGALRRFHLTRENAMLIPLAFSGLVGLDMRSERALGIMEWWRCWMEQGTFNGPHANDPGVDTYVWGNKLRGHCSHDPRVFGHRHDEAALSFVLHTLGLTPGLHGIIAHETNTPIIGHHVKEEI